MQVNIIVSPPVTLERSLFVSIKIDGMVRVAAATPHVKVADCPYNKNEMANALCLVPGLAFSADGARLGYGKGYYDTFFARHSVLKLGLCYDFQLVPQVPTQPHDVRMDGILTDKRLVLTADEERME